MGLPVCNTAPVNFFHEGNFIHFKFLNGDKKNRKGRPARGLSMVYNQF